jgi:hypothetical protein
MARDPEKRHAPPVEARIIDDKTDRYFVVRYPRAPSPGYSYHYFLLQSGNQLTKLVTRAVIRKILDLPRASENELAKFYDQVFTGEVDMKIVRKLRAEDRGAPVSR